MSTATQDQISIKIMGRTYSIKCPADKIAALQESANYLDKKMAETAESGRVSSPDRIAVITALNVAHELLELKQQNQTYLDAMHQRIKLLHEKIDHELEAETN